MILACENYLPLTPALSPPSWRDIGHAHRIAAVSIKPERPAFPGNRFRLVVHSDFVCIVRIQHLSHISRHFIHRIKIFHIYFPHNVIS